MFLFYMLSDDGLVFGRVAKESHQLIETLQCASAELSQ